MFYSGDTISIPDDRLTATENTGKHSPVKAKLASIGRGLKRSVAGIFRNEGDELEQIARDPRMLDDIGLTRADVEPMLRRRSPVVLQERYHGRF
jgi:hypothetical protein